MNEKALREKARAVARRFSFLQLHSGLCEADEKADAWNEVLQLAGFASRVERNAHHLVLSGGDYAEAEAFSRKVLGCFGAFAKSDDDFERLANLIVNTAHARRPAHQPAPDTCRPTSVRVFA